MPFLQTPADSSGMGSFLQESVGHGEVLGWSGKGLMEGEGKGLIEGMWCWRSSPCLGHRSSHRSRHVSLLLTMFPARSLSVSSCCRPVLSLRIVFAFGCHAQ